MNSESVRLSIFLTYTPESKYDVFCKIVPSNEFLQIYTLEKVAFIMDTVLCQKMSRNEDVKRVGKQKRKSPTPTKSKSKKLKLSVVNNDNNDNKIIDPIHDQVWGFDYTKYDKFLKFIEIINNNRRALEQCLQSSPSGVTALPKIVINGLPSWCLYAMALRQNAIKNASYPPRTYNDYIADNSSNNNNNSNSIFIDKLGEKLWNKLFWFQKDCVKYGVEKRGRIVIADEMGLGKSIQALAIAKYYQESWPVLIVCTAKCCGVWQYELEEHLDISEDDVYHVEDKRSLTLPPPTVPAFASEGKGGQGPRPLFYIMSYGLVDALKEVIESYNFQMIIIDESARLKNEEAKRTMAMVPIIQKAKYAILLTGTFALKPKQGLSSVRALWPQLFTGREDYLNRYCDPQRKCIGKNRWITSYDGCSNRNELHVVLTNLLMIRRTKKEVKLKMPPMHRYYLTLNPDKKQIKLVDKHMTKVNESLEQLKKSNKNNKNDKKTKSSKYDESRDNDDDNDDDHNNKSKKEEFGKDNAFLTAYRKIGKIKLPLVQDHIRDYIRNKLADGEKFLLFGHHQLMLDGIQEVLEEEQIGYVRLDGKTKSKDSAKIIKTFQKNPMCRAAILSITSASAGLTLTAAQTEFFLELHTDTENIIQAECRAWRYGQTKPVDIYYLIFPKSIECTIFELTNRKFKNLTGIVDGVANSFVAKRVEEKE